MEREAKQKEEAEGASRDQFSPPPPPMTQQNFVQYMQLVEERQRITLEQQNKFFQELLQQNRVERPENPGVTLADFQNTKPISYAPEPMDAEDWLMDTERKLNTVGCNDQEKVRYATHLLCGPAASWWDNIVAIYPAGKVFTWEEFARKFRESNVPESIVELKRREFESLEQKDKAILTYVREFSKLSRYAVEEVNTEDKKKKRFLRGLSPQFKVQLRMMRATEFQELVDAAITLEDDFKQLQEEKRKKAKFEPKRFVSNKPNTSLSFKPRYNNNNNNNNNNNSNYYGSRKNQAFQTGNQIVCRSCGLTGNIAKDCKKPRIICFGCRQEGHMMKDCPNKKNGGGQSGGGGNRGGNTGGNWKNKKPFGKLNCTSLEEVVNSDQAVIDQVEFLGHVISKDGIAVNPSKVAAVLEWEAPKTVKEIRGFLGMAGYYRRFIEGFSKIAGPMTKLLRKNTPFVWSEECEKSFQTLKEKLTTTPVLAVPEVGKDYTVYCDASKHGLGCVLMQDRKVISYGSRQLRPHETPDEPVSHEELELQPDLTYIEKPAKILEENWKQLRNRAIKYCKIQWKHHPEREATWEKEEDLRKTYPELFRLSESSEEDYDNNEGAEIIGYEEPPLWRLTTFMCALQGTPISFQLYYKPLAPSATRRPVYEDGATKVLRLINMISPDQLEDDEYYQKFCLRVTEEGQRYGGKLVRTVVPRPDPSGAPVAGVGKVFLEYADLDSSTYSKAMLHWMWFRGKHVMALFYPEDKFANGDYDG
ncbi:hypothetical protein QYE76_039006 [Lolium multiflorum]|uniref:CCHC-type domain-containing protein n=1 Tax=Lolium multiflorum TaxID=4521 RepID=A0AAD8TAJ6_LOLMU|nr:hypothetical protein QYE76_039006 [Lolium multiflorum]